MGGRACYRGAWTERPGSHLEGPDGDLESPFHPGHRCPARAAALDRPALDPSARQALATVLSTRRRPSLEEHFCPRPFPPAAVTNGHKSTG